VAVAAVAVVALVVVVVVVVVVAVVVVVVVVMLMSVAVSVIALAVVVVLVVVREVGGGGHALRHVSFYPTRCSRLTRARPITRATVKLFRFETTFSGRSVPRTRIATSAYPVVGRTKRKRQGQGRCCAAQDPGHPTVHQQLDVICGYYRGRSVALL
jgi:hypothetical protein